MKNRKKIPYLVDLQVDIYRLFELFLQFQHQPLNYLSICQFVIQLLGIRHILLQSL